MSTCPECGEEYSPQGMYGHLRMGHGLRGDELEETYEQTQQTQEQAQEQGRATVTETEDSESESLGASLPPVPSSPSDQGREVTEDRRTTEDRKPVQKAETSTHGDRVAEAADRLRRAKQRLQEVEAKTGEEVEQEFSSSSSSPLANGPSTRAVFRGLKNLGLAEGETTVERTEAEKALCRECREEVQAAERELEKALEHEQVERRYAGADT